MWRRLLVPASVCVAKLHDMFQAAMGWTNSHLHSFTIGGDRYGMHFDDYPEDEIDEKQVTVLRAIGEHRSFSYEYDFGDAWEHEVMVEDFARTSLGLKHAVCVDGQNACPPENCGEHPVHHARGRNCALSSDAYRECTNACGASPSVELASSARG